MEDIRYIVIRPEIPEIDYIELPNKAIMDGSISSGAFRLLSLVLGVKDPLLSDKWYAEQLGLSMPTLYRYKKELREAGYIK